MASFDTPLKSIPRILPKYQKTLEKIGIFSVRDFLFHFPFRYDDFRRLVSLSQEFLGQAVTVEGRIVKGKLNRIFKRKITVTEIILEDTNGKLIKATWFNQPYILESLPAGSTARLSGKLELQGKYFLMNSPSWEKSTRDATNTGRLVPVYPETKGLTSKWIRWQMKMLLPLVKNIPDTLPEDIRKKYNLYEIITALTQIHFPESYEKMIRAQKRFAFEEMFLVQLRSLRTKKEWNQKKSAGIKFDENLIQKFVKKLPFKLTDAQRKASFEVLKNLEKTRPMNRLLNGDVGAGKTVVAAIATLQTIFTNHQVAIMAPTEVLARQHFLTFSELLKNYAIDIALLTNSYREMTNFKSNPNDKISKDKKSNRLELLEKIKNGEIKLVIGTHALIQKDVYFKNLALVVIDEQHRFGVAQRAALQNQTMSIDDGNDKIIPHLLTMTATPIPRTLAIALFGSLDLSILDEMPRNRKPIITKAVAPDAQSQVYNFIRSEIKKGRQAFVIFPLVTESEKMSEIKAATEEHKRLSEKVFPELKLGLMHGKLKPKEKEEVMRKYKDRGFDILISTSVVEVGIDIPNATVMIIENAERFGLSQLHQFRGRVGRSIYQSYCFLFSEKDSRRLKIMEKTTDGFEIAEQDLKLRGPGQFFGTLQSGLPDITMESLNNINLIKFARAEAQEILKSDPQLKKHPLLAEALEKFSEKVHLE